MSGESINPENRDQTDLAAISKSGIEPVDALRILRNLEPATAAALAPFLSRTVTFCCL
jgi:hypothetical protein